MIVSGNFADNILPPPRSREKLQFLRLLLKKKANLKASLDLKGRDPMARAAEKESALSTKPKNKTSTNNVTANSLICEGRAFFKISVKRKNETTRPYKYSQCQSHQQEGGLAQGRGFFPVCRPVL